MKKLIVHIISYFQIQKVHYLRKQLNKKSFSIKCMNFLLMTIKIRSLILVQISSQ